jgi:membrane associated rhomboid family serine protease
MENLISKFREVWYKRNNGIIQLIVLNVMLFSLVHIFWLVTSLLDTPKAMEVLGANLYLSSSFSTFLYHPWTLFFNFFTEGRGETALLHTLFNMLTLYWFGQMAMAYMGNRRFVALYVYGGLAGGLAYLALVNLNPMLLNLSQPSYMYGATACIYAVITGTAVLVPNVKVRLLFLGDVAIKYVALVYIILSFFGAGSKNMAANFAYLGGVVMGIIFMLSYQKGRDLGVYFWTIIDFFSKISTPKPKIRVKQKATAGGTKSSKIEGYSGKSSPTQDEVDAILDKISAYGYESLTTEEKQTLFKASQKK